MHVQPVVGQNIANKERGALIECVSTLSSLIVFRFQHLAP